MDDKKVVKLSATGALLIIAILIIAIMCIFTYKVLTEKNMIEKRVSELQSQIATKDTTILRVT